MRFISARPRKASFGPETRQPCVAATAGRGALAGSAIVDACCRRGKQGLRRTFACAVSRGKIGELPRLSPSFLRIAVVGAGVILQCHSYGRAQGILGSQIVIATSRHWQADAYRPARSL